MTILDEAIYDFRSVSVVREQQYKCILNKQKLLKLNIDACPVAYRNGIPCLSRLVNIVDETQACLGTDCIEVFQSKKSKKNA